MLGYLHTIEIINQVQKAEFPGVNVKALSEQSGVSIDFR